MPWRDFGWDDLYFGSGMYENFCRNPRDLRDGAFCYTYASFGKSSYVFVFLFNIFVLESFARCLFLIIVVFLCLLFLVMILFALIVVLLFVFLSLLLFCVVFVSDGFVVLVFCLSLLFCYPC